MLMSYNKRLRKAVKFRMQCEISLLHKAAKAKMKQELSEAQNHRCCYCHVRFSDDSTSLYYATFEHVVPKSHGGDDDFTNLVLACYECNHSRSNRYSAEDFSNLMQRGRLYMLMDTLHYVWNIIKTDEKLVA